MDTIGLHTVALPDGSPKNLKLTVLYALVFSLQAFAIGWLLSYFKISNAVIGDFYAAIAAILLLSNIFGFGSDRFLTIQVTRLKKFYLNSLCSNLQRIFVFFFGLFLMVGLITLVLDGIVFFIFHHSPQLIHNKFSHPVELCFFCVFFFMLANFMAAFLQSEGYHNPVMKIAIYCYLLRIVLVYLILVWDVKFSTNIDKDYDLVITLCLAVSSVELVRIIGYGQHIYKYLQRIKSFSENNIDNGWKKDIWLYALLSLQYDWVVVAIIIQEMVGNNEHFVGVLGNVLVMVRLFSLLGRVFQQNTRDGLAQAVIYNLQLKRQLRRNFMIYGGLIGLLWLVLISFSVMIAKHYQVMDYLSAVRNLITVAAIKAIVETVFLVVIFAYSRKIMQLYTYAATAIYLVFVAKLMLYPSLSIANLIDTFLVFYWLITILELILGLFIISSAKFKRINRLLV